MSAVLATVLTAILLGLGASSVQAERRVQLINFDTTVWRYFTNGTDLPTQSGNTWKSRTYADGAWPSGPGLLGVETTPQNYPYPFNTTFAAYDPNIITFYFRAHFNMAASDYVWPLQFVMSNLCDDGCAVYLNSNFVTGIRVAQNAAYNAVATAGPPAEGAYEPTFTIPNATNGLVVGDNVVAVDVHQTGTGSTDIALGLSLTAIVPTTLTITSQPPSQVSASIGSQFTISAGVSGGPGLHQWQQSNNGTTWANVAGSSNPTNGLLTYTAVPSTASTTLYRLVVSNGVNTVISGTSTVTVTADTSGPYMVSANVMEEATRTNRVMIIWSERLASGSVQAGSGTNFTVVLANSNVTVTVSNVLYNPSGGPDADPVTILTMSTTNWHYGSNYYIIANRIRDGQNNAIAPNSVIGVSWPLNVSTNLMDFSAGWEYHTDWGNPFNPDLTIYQQAWYAKNYDTATNGHWGSGCGVLYKDAQVDPGTYVPCRGTINICSGLGSYVRNPTLFRSSFVVPPNLATDVTLRVSAVADDGYILYLNGSEIRRERVNPATAGVLPDENTRSSSEVVDGTCTSNNLSVTLMPGTNVIAAAVCQWNTEGANGGDTYWALRLDVTRTTYRTGPVPPNGVPPSQVKLFATRLPNRNVVFTWPTNIWGYTLEYTTNVVRGGQSAVLGPWYQAQTNLANGMMTNYPTGGPARIYRLHKVP